MKSIIMAGGSGTRLWPFSRNSFPKQFLTLLDDLSFIQITAKRLSGFTKSEDIYVVSGESYKFNICSHLSELFATEYNNLILEPAGRNTAPAIALAVKYFLENGSDESEVLMFHPSDHIMKPEENLTKAVKASLELAQDHIITFGIIPNKPETGYGYIELGKEKTAQTLEVKRFVEKPDYETAKKYVESGKYMWNSGMFMFSIGCILREFEQFAPTFHNAIMQWTFSEMIARYSELDSISIDYAVMEKSPNILCTKLDIEWNDIGSWDSVYEMLPKDANGNAVLGPVEVLDTKNSLIVSNKNLTSIIGVDNLAVICTEDAMLVSDRKKTQQVKELVNQMKINKRKEVTEHVTTYRPWGSFTVLEEGPRYKIKRIVVKPGVSLSLQRHHHRSEHWVVIKGMAEVKIGDDLLFLHENQSAYVPIYVTHRLSNPGKIPLEIIEVQNGEYVGEDDIERLEDTYGRA